MDGQTDGRTDRTETYMGGGIIMGKSQSPKVSTNHTWTPQAEKKVHVLIRNYIKVMWSEVRII